MHYVEHLSINYKAMTDEAIQAAWFQTLPTEITLRAILATQIKVYHIYFVIKSKKMGHKVVEIDFENDKISQQKHTMKTSITQLIRELTLVETSISVDERHFLATIENLNITDCEDVAGALGTLAARFLSQCGRSHFTELRK